MRGFVATDRFGFLVEDAKVAGDCVECVLVRGLLLQRPLFFRSFKDPQMVGDAIQTGTLAVAKKVGERQCRHEQPRGDHE